MLTRKSLLRILPGLPRTSVHGPWSRVVGAHVLHGPPPGMPPGSAPQPLWPGGPSLRGARFTKKGGENCVYLASDAVTAMAEVQAIYLPPGGSVVQLATNPWTMLTIHGVVTEVLDLTDASIQTALRTNLSELTGDWAYTQATGGLPPTQLLGQAAFDCRAILGLKYVSAKNLGRGYNLVIFSDRLSSHPSCSLSVQDSSGSLVQRLP